MTNDPGELTPEQAFVDRLKSSRRSSAVLKARLITLRSDMPNAVVLAVEGDDDKVVYGQWLRRIRPALRYEPFPCGGKKEVRELRNALNRDLTRLDENVFYLVDRDFDDLEGFHASDRVFMTDSYSVENYLVTDEVLEELLRDEFPCHARPDLRRTIIQTFGNDYADFLQATAAVNLRIFVARRVQIELIKRLPTSLRQLALVRVGNVGPAGTAPEELVAYEREPSAEELERLTEAFGLLEPKMRYRGKFALKFFREWLDRLADEYARGDLGLFGQAKPDGSVRRSELVLSNFASKSRIPTGLPAFVDEIP